MSKPLFCAALLAAAAPAAAIAASGLPAPYYSNSFESDAYNPDTYAQTHYASGVYGAPVTVTDPYLSLAVGGTPTPFVAVRAHGTNGVFATGGGSIEYFFAVDGPAPVVVPLSAHIIIDATAGSGAFDYGGGEVDIDTDQGSVSRMANADHGGSVDASAMIPHARVDETVAFSATAGMMYQNEIMITGAATVEVGRHQSGSTNVFVDPFIAIDPTWARTHPGYSLAFSAGIDNVRSAGGVPEPASWALLVAGFGLTGAAVRRRRAAVVAA